MSYIRGAWPLLGGRSGVCRCLHRNQLSSSSSSVVLQSRCTDVFQNLALEDWIDANVDLQQRSVLLLWRNHPAVVIGRHQNPWTECDLTAVRRMGIPLARRRSGGGTVFHDLGNLNLTFFTSKKAYDRKRNLKVITDALRSTAPGLDVHATDRLDILLNGRYKISGTASRLSRKSSYHHCTLLHSADRSALSTVLRPSCPGIVSNATPSVPSPVANLLDHAPMLQWEELVDVLVRQYNTEFGFSAVSAFVDPADESAFPGISRAAAELRSWDWTFGKTPKFSVQTVLDLTDKESAVRSSAHLNMEVKHGFVNSCKLFVPDDWLPPHLSAALANALVGERFCRRRASVCVAAVVCDSGDLRGRLRRLSDAVLSVMS
ncbi:hypothetical protein JOB18_045384 [Solea senegalensis]|uniref:Lipoyltransferase 1, mitochondrial n=2 Tax=Solea senegalensis TaxID=28829 RepID=A0AAV6RIH4_SOLSE|nr:lipoyltransferase 1, mitochondrial isoform X2 [Solea senegalensis]XP_043874706.1 lipoyltransferase 1, mitochondrial isoform X2 [Solea senegalensis]KAG7503805.1 lipoyltransferase 1, mitochondrial [Solea senegalensis]KAG7503806.1 hypothetical protein JOB18_045384 [Solea senegalensis]KAG7503807.1 hypothetical protein JOB18_045384 [Solea senegalensis]